MMTGNTDKTGDVRDGLVYTMRPVADRFTRAVHARDSEAREILEDLTGDELRALALALAELRPAPVDDGIVDITAVLRVLDGHPAPLREIEQVEAAKICIRDGIARRRLRDLLHVGTDKVERLWQQAQAILAYEHRGVTTGQEPAAPAEQERPGAAA